MNGEGKVCTACGESFPATAEFFGRRGDRLHSRCHECRRRKQREATRAYNERHPLLRHAYYESVKDRHRAQMREWRQSNRLAVRLSTARYRARKRGAGGKHSTEDVLAQIASQAGLCYWCSTRLDDGYEVDHFIPVSRGGSNDPGNIVAACRPCNRGKHAKAPEVFLAQMIDERGPRTWLQ